MTLAFVWKAITITWLVVGWLLGSSWWRPALVKAAEPTTIFQEDFSNFSPDSWTLHRNSQYSNPSLPCMLGAQPAAWNVYNGRFGITIDGPPCTTEITPNGLTLSEDAGFEFSFDWLLAESISMDRNALLIWQDPHNWYDIKILNHSVLVQKVVNGVSLPLDDNYGRFPFKPNHEHRVVIRYTLDKMIEVEIDGQRVITLQDTAPFLAGNRSLGLQASVGALNRSSSYFDNLVVKTWTADNPDDKLVVTFFKQIDPTWKDEIYDAGPNWSDQPTIGRWGCAMTSAAMILDYHGIKQLPDGQQLTPSTLNTWLQQQPDGYVGSGLVNWQAITRLTQIMSDQNGTPKLEYARSGGDPMSIAQAKIDDQQPVMLQIPGHFLVGNGIASRDQSNPDLWIQDPAYSYDKLSQHQQPLLSTRTFQPSQTDLSYILAVTGPETTVTITDQDGNQPAAVQTYAEQLRDPTTGSDRLSPLHSVTTLTKPETGTYQITVSNPELEQIPVDIWAYDAKANATHVLEEAIIGQEPITFSVSFDKEKPAKLKPDVNFQKLIDDLSYLRSSQHLTSTYWQRRLSRYAQLGLQLQARGDSTLPQQHRLAGLIQRQIRAANRYLTAEGKAYLHQQTGWLIDNVTP